MPQYNQSSYPQYGAGYKAPPPPPPAGQIALIKNGARQRILDVKSVDRDWWDVARTVYPPKEDGILEIPFESVDVSYGVPTFNACVFNASEDYLQSMWGRKLHSSDQTWLSLHPYATEGGIPAEYMATAINQMVEPYGFGVSEVRYRKGLLLMGDDAAGWLQALGCNPLGMMDHSTTNQEAMAKLSMDAKLAGELWRAEFHDDPLPGSIIGERGWSDGKGVTTGSFGGHARYLAPRATAGNWVVSVRLLPLKEITYMTPPPNPEYVPRKGPETFTLSSVKRPDGKPVAVMQGGRFVPPEEVTPINIKTTVIESRTHDERWDKNGKFIGAPAYSKDDSYEADFFDGLGGPEDMADGYEWGQVGREVPNALIKTTCDICGDDLEYLDDCELPVCLQCYEDVWEGYACPHCKTAFTPELTPFWIENENHLAVFECPNNSCLGRIPLSLDIKDDGLAKLVKAAQSL
jgi:hypothetical protein